MNQYIDEVSEPLSYDAEFQIFTFVSDDNGFSGIMDNGLEVYFENYPSDLYEEMYGIMEVYASCVNPYIFEVSNQDDLPPDSYYGNVFFKMEDWEYKPRECEIIFSCELVDGPRTDADLCSLPGVSDFDSTYGDWYFFSTD
jgi:hypothetical protein